LLETWRTLHFLLFPDGPYCADNSDAMRQTSSQEVRPANSSSPQPPPPVIGPSVNQKEQVAGTKKERARKKAWRD